MHNIGGGGKGERSQSGSISASSVDRRDPYEILGVAKDATEQEIKAAYRKLALRFHPDKNVDNPEVAEAFTEIAYSYGILSDPEKKRQYDNAGFEAIDFNVLDMELDLSNLGTVNTMFAALFSKLGVPIKTAISPYVLEDALNGTVTIRDLPYGRPIHDKVERQMAHFFKISINETQAEAGVVVRVTSNAQSKFKLLYFEEEENGGLGLALQEDSVKTGKVTSAGMYFLHFQVYRLDPTLNALAMAKEPEFSFFKKLDGLQPCEVLHLKPGKHVFAVYGDNFFRSAHYTIEAVCVDSHKDSVEKLKEVEAQLLAKWNELRRFEVEYKEVMVRFAAVNIKFREEKHAVDDLIKSRLAIQNSFSVAPRVRRHASCSHLKLSRSYSFTDDSVNSADEAPPMEYNEKPRKKRWFKIKFKPGKSNG